MDAAALAAEPRHLISRTGATEAAYGAAEGAATGLTLDQRAVMLATAVSVDFDYFSRSRGGAFGGMMPYWMMGGGEGAGAAGSAGAAGAAGAGEAAGGVAGLGEGAVTGAATMAGYEAMRGGHGSWGAVDDASPVAGQPPPPPQQPEAGAQGAGGEEVWDEGFPWGNEPKAGGRDDGPRPTGGDVGGEGGGAGDGFDVSDWF
jgi:hypothetical protein